MKIMNNLKDKDARETNHKIYTDEEGAKSTEKTIEYLHNHSTTSEDFYFILTKSEEFF